jgi:UDP-N-acetylmuramyl pentapeptide phosphotransferase/UDP-N-acetylglucosamine-1-phosphate transferase
VPDGRPLLGLALALGLVFAATPVAIRVAARFDFYDRPAGYKGHGAPTPYLGGAPVVAAFVAVLLLLTTDWSRSLPLIGGVLVLWAVGTVDDRRSLGPGTRIVFEVALAALVFVLGFGWNLGAGDAVDLGATVLWVIAVVNALNLFDNMDGAASSIAAVISAAVAALGFASDDLWVAVAGAALAGACMGFLPHNLRSPARIFLGDGGSMPIGFALAFLVMGASGGSAPAWQAFAIGVLLVGIPALDTALVIVSRRRRGVPVLQGGRDHLTHRTLSRLHDARAVALALGGTQAVLAALALVAAGRSSTILVAFVTLYLAGAATAIVMLDRQAAVAEGSSEAQGAPARRAAAGRAYPLIALGLGIAVGLAPFFDGYYHATTWAPLGIGLIVCATAAWIARPVNPGRAGAAVLGGIALLGLLALLSSSWSTSPTNAVVSANRYLTYAAMIALLVAVVRTRAAAIAALAGVVLAALVIAGIDMLALLDGRATDIFLGHRLQGPLDYVNGQANFFLLAAWPCIALVHQRRFPMLGGFGLGAATLLLGLMILSESRGAILAALVSVVVVVVFSRARLRLIAGLGAVLAGVAAALPAILDVFPDSEISAPEAAGAGRAIVVAALVVGTLGWLALALERGLAREAPVALARARVVMAVAVGFVLAAGVGVFAANATSIADTIHNQYVAFVELDPTQGSDSSSTRLVSGGGNRFDYWRVAGATFADHRLAGAGAGSYSEAYFRERRTREDIRQPHSIQLETLAELGLIGGAVLLVVLGAVAAVFWRWRRAVTDPTERALLAATLGIAVAWFVHSSVDWIHLLPGLTGIALIALAVAIRGVPARAARAPDGARWRRLAPAIAAAVVLAVAGVSLARQALSDLYRERARDALAASPERAVIEADRSLRLDGNAVDSYYIKAAALARFGAADATERVLEEAIAREPGNFLTYAVLGDVYVRQGRIKDARAAYADALERNPRNVALQALVKDPESALEGAE